MGVPRGFYGPFSEFLAEAGLTVLRFDYRGIGGSLRGHVSASDATMHSWGEQDLAGAIRFLREREPGLPLLLVGHSAGGQLLGLAPDANDVRAALFVAAQSGYWRNWSGAGRLRMLFYWTVLFPSITRAFGYLPLKRLTELESLMLPSADLTDAWLVYIEDLKKLKSLQLYDMAITTDGSSARAPDAPSHRCRLRADHAGRR